jgi:hypothetical protein
LSRDDGFATADLDVKFLRDPKIRRLWKRLPPGEAKSALILYLGVVLSSWEQGDRVSIDDAISFDTVTPQRVEALKAELLDDDGKVPFAVWERWFEPAWDRRERSRAGGREGNRRRWRRDGDSITGRSVADSIGKSDADSLSLPSTQSIPSRPAPRSLGAEAASPSEVVVVEWLRQRGCVVEPGSGYHRKLREAIQRHGPAATLETLETLAHAGMLDGDIKGFVFGAIDALDARTRPKLADLQAAERAAELDRSLEARLERTRRNTAEYRAAIATHSASQAEVEREQMADV